jgi:hypothetical protein
MGSLSGFGELLDEEVCRGRGNQPVLDFDVRLRCRARLVAFNWAQGCRVLIRHLAQQFASPDLGTQIVFHLVHAEIGELGRQVFRGSSARPLRMAATFAVATINIKAKARDFDLRSQ